MKTYTNFSDVAKALGYKTKKVVKKEKAQTCPDCGHDMRNVEGTNVWFCEWTTLEDKKLKDETPVQVFTTCGRRVFATA